MAGQVRGIFGGTGNSGNIENASDVDLFISGTFVGTVQLQTPMADASGADAWQAIGANITAPGMVTVRMATARKWRVACTAYTSGTIVYELSGGRNLQIAAAQ
jgi:hypothetical protein